MYFCSEFTYLEEIQNSASLLGLLYSSGPGDLELRMKNIDCLTSLVVKGCIIGIAAQQKEQTMH